MATYDVSYCNTTTDLVAELPQVETFDRKRQVDNYRFTVHSGSTYKAPNTGYVGRVFRAGIDLGAAQSGLVELNADGEWYYDSGADTLYVYSSTDLTGAGKVNVFVAPDTWANIKTEAVGRASERLRSYINKPILPRAGATAKSETGRDYEDNIIRATAIYACALLAYPHDQVLGKMMEQRVYRANPATDEEYGLADQIKRGDVALWNEVTSRFNQGVARVVSVNASTTGGPVEIRGRATTSFDLIRIKIGTGGTFAPGTPCAVTYTVAVGDSTGIKTSAALSATTITGGWQPMAHGLEVRWATGVYTANDEWEVEVRGDQPESGSSLSSAQIWRM